MPSAARKLFLAQKPVIPVSFGSLNKNKLVNWSSAHQSVSLMQITAQVQHAPQPEKVLRREGPISTSRAWVLVVTKLVTETTCKRRSIHWHRPAGFCVIVFLAIHIWIHWTASEHRVGCCGVCFVVELVGGFWWFYLFFFKFLLTSCLLKKS